MEATIALAGNPNSGKTTLFNALTGARQHVGNYPGVTVEKKQGTYSENRLKFTIVDLPGTYSLTAYSLEEVVARDFLLNEKPGVVVNIVDAANLERNLYLTLQFMEMGIPVCIALNMMDVAKTRGIEIDIKKLSTLLGIPVVPTVARSGKGKKALMETVSEHIRDIKFTPLLISYGEDIDGALNRIEEKIIAANFLTDKYPSRWTALKYLEKDEQVLKAGNEANPVLSKEIKHDVLNVSDHLKKTLDTYPEAIIADQRYGYINSILKQGVVRHQKDQSRLHLSDKIDKVVTNRFLGPIIMLAVLMGLYKFTFTYSELPVGWVESCLGWISGIAEAHMPEGLLKSLIISGIIDGVGGVLGFAPLIMFMFFGISILEDSGYLARVAFMLDRVFSFFGLHGSSVMAFIVSGGIAGGCAVPGVMATRTLKSRRERLATLLTVPFMNCGAKLPVFALLTAAFFAENEAKVMFIITLIAWLGALLVAKLLRVTIIKGESTPFVMELPPYRLPTFRGLLIHTWERTWQYIKKAGTIIVGISIILWALMVFPGLPETETISYEQKRQAVIASIPAKIISELEAVEEDTELSEAANIFKDRLFEVDAQEAEAALRNSVAGRLGTALESITRLAGFDWRTNIALVGGFAAKEVVVSTLGTAYSLGEVDPEEIGSLSEALPKAPGWRPLTALSLIIFTIFYAPCFVAVVCIAREAGSWKWGAFSMVFNTALAFGLSVIVFQIGSLLGY
ncbi:MAG: ferrous iron transport protein B [Desulfobacterales bacterium]|nr:ferrous iron transport protein B [Desulfobacterales bacterium]